MYASFLLRLVVLASLGAVALPDGRVIMCGGGYIELAEGGRVSTAIIPWWALNSTIHTVYSTQVLTNNDYVPIYRIFRQTFFKINKPIFMK